MEAVSGFAHLSAPVGGGMQLEGSQVYLSPATGGSTLITKIEFSIRSSLVTHASDPHTPSQRQGDSVSLRAAWSEQIKTE